MAVGHVLGGGQQGEAAVLGQVPKSGSCVFAPLIAQFGEIAAAELTESLGVMAVPALQLAGYPGLLPGR